MAERQRIERLLSNFSDEEKLAVGVDLARFLALQDPVIPLYLVADRPGAMLTGPEMAGEIVSQTHVGQSFVELFIAGAEIAAETQRGYAEGLVASRQLIQNAVERNEDR